jgi:hypothetical protein
MSSQRSTIKLHFQLPPKHLSAITREQSQSRSFAIFPTKKYRISNNTAKAESDLKWVQQKAYRNEKKKEERKTMNGIAFSLREKVEGR